MEKLDINRYIPFGTTLQDVLKHVSITKAKINNLLKIRGVFLESIEDKKTFPILVSTILSPLEFQYIQDNIVEKEDTKKLSTRPLEWHSKEDLIDVVPYRINLSEILGEEFSRLKIIDESNFTMINGNRNRVQMEFRCQTNNFNSAWYRTKNEFPAEIIIERVEKENKINLKMFYTSEETKRIADAAINFLVEDFRNKKYTKPDAVPEKILYSNFKNEERVAFFLSMTSDWGIFTFKRVTDLDIGPDKTLDLPSEMNKIMSGNVSAIKFTGESLHEHYLIKDSTNHKFVEIAVIEAIYDFNYHGAEGSCHLRFGFPGYLRKRSSRIEFSIDIPDIEIRERSGPVNRENVHLHLLQEFEKFKMINYNYINYQKIPQQYTPPQHPGKA